MGPWPGSCTSQNTHGSLFLGRARTRGYNAAAVRAAKKSLGGISVPEQEETPALGEVLKAIESDRGGPVSRRTFLKGAGIGSLGLAALPTLGSALATSARADDLLNIQLVTVSRIPKPQPPVDWLIMAGNGTHHGSHLSGGGNWLHVLFPGPNVPPPWEVVAHGTWRFKELVSLDNIGSALGFAAGVLETWADFWVAESGETLTVPTRVVCNLGPAGLVTAFHEGLYVSDTPAGNFEPLEPELGLTAFVMPM